MACKYAPRIDSFQSTIPLFQKNRFSAGVAKKKTLRFYFSICVEGQLTRNNFSRARVKAV